jgi:hypothetical protein
MVGTTTSAKDVTMAPRRRSRSEGSTKAALELQVSLAQSTRHSERATAFPRFAMTELYVRTSEGVVFQDEDFQRQTIAKAERLVETALSPESSERNALIAKKALKYREMRARKPNHAADVPDMAARAQSCPVATD